jgi:uncharacterized protein YrrD
MLNKAKMLKNYSLNCSDGEIGKVKDFYFDDQTWAIRYLVVNTGNWLTGRQVLVSPHSVVSVNKSEKSITIDLMKSQIENSPILENEKPVSKQFHSEFDGYFRYPMYSTGMGYGGVGTILPITPIETNIAEIPYDPDDADAWDPNLRSTHHVSDYGIQSLDDQIGHVDDFVIDDETWIIRYLEIDTKNWLPGRKILISPNWTDHISWKESLIFVNLNSEQIKQSPEYKEESIINRDFERILHTHYNQKAY